MSAFLHGAFAVGVLLFVVGVALVYLPAAFIVGGALICGAAWVIHYEAKGGQP